MMPDGMYRVRGTVVCIRKCLPPAPMESAAEGSGREQATDRRRVAVPGMSAALLVSGATGFRGRVEPRTYNARFPRSLIVVCGTAAHRDDSVAHWIVAHRRPLRLARRLESVHCYLGIKSHLCDGCRIS